MACKCIDGIRRSLKRRHGEPYHSVCGIVFLYPPTTAAPIEVCEALRVRVRQKRKDGEWSKRWKETSVLSTYCPFCGTRYETKGETT